MAVWKKGEVRAPHKPLLILYALGRWVKGQRSSIYFSEAEPQLKELLAEFGPTRKSYEPEHPFFRLQNDDTGRLWVITADGPLLPRTGNTNPPKRELIAKRARGAFTAEVQKALEADATLAERIAAAVLAAHFPESYHREIRDAVGLDEAAVAPTQPRQDRAQRTTAVRDARFRDLVLNAYQHQCAVCGFGVILDRQTVGVEAAHIRWHTHGGPAEESNGLALCALHHSLLDRGAFTLQEQTIVVSDQVRGPEVEASLLRHHRQPCRRPTHSRQEPLPAHVHWHRHNVFKGEARP